MARLSVTTARSDEYASISKITHQRAEVNLITVSRDKISMMLAAGSSLHTNFFSLMIGISISILLSLKSGSVEKDWQQTFWLAFWVSLVLTSYFGARALFDEIRKYRFRKEFVDTDPADGGAPAIEESHLQSAVRIVEKHLDKNDPAS